MAGKTKLRQKDLLREFEEKLQRPLDGKEKSFIDWLVAQEANHKLINK